MLVTTVRNKGFFIIYPCKDLAYFLLNQENKFYLQGLSTVKGPVMFPIKKHHAICYPTTHSVPGPFLRSYINLPNKTYAY